MPAARPRLHVTPTETAYRLLVELSELTGMGVATVVRTWLDDAIPEMEMQVALMREAKKRPAQVQASMARFATRAIEDLTQAQLDLDKAMEKKRGPKPKDRGRGAANTG